MKFTKMHGAGNDYIYLNGSEPLPCDLSAWTRRVCDRHFGVGADGVVVVLPSATCDFQMRIYNADGSEAEMCGNASRCVGKYVYDRGLTPKTELTLETRSGTKHLSLLPVDGVVEQVRVDMGEPALAPESIPTLFTGDRVVGSRLAVGGETFELTCVSMGNPHAVVFVPDTDACDLHRTGPLIETHSCFPRRTNVEFVEVLSPQRLKMRVWERGVGETLACGTGACASLVAAVLTGRADRRAVVELPGGVLEIEWRESDNRVYMTGDAVTVFEGEWPDTR